MLSGFPLSGRCTIQRDCKLAPIRAYHKTLPPDTMQYIGIAADEPKRLTRLNGNKTSLLDKYHMTEAEARTMCEAEGCCLRCTNLVGAAAAGFARTHRSANFGIYTTTTRIYGSACSNCRMCRIRPPSVSVGNGQFER